MSKMYTEKTIYFVRHGESEDNTRPVFQAAESPLSDHGREQAKKIAERAAKLDFQALVSSSYLRAKETAGEIAKTTGKTAEYLDLFVERIKPTSINGKSHDDVEAQVLWKQWNESLYDKDLKVEDGENYEEIIERADKALDFLKNHTAKNILVVTHGFFFRVIMSRVILGDSMTAENLKNFQSVAAMKNTGLSVLQYGTRNEKDDSRWHFWVYNDHTHLG